MFELDNRPSLGDPPEEPVRWPRHVLRWPVNTAKILTVAQMCWPVAEGLLDAPGANLLR